MAESRYGHRWGRLSGADPLTSTGTRLMPKTDFPRLLNAVLALLALGVVVLALLAYTHAYPWFFGSP